MPTPRLSLIIGQPLAEALDRHCREHDVKPSAFVRRAIARALKQPKLADSVEPPGRRWPKK